jgi:UDP-glucose 4-epimerase
MTLRGKNVLVTGGAGFIGSHLVDRIIHDDPASLVVVDNFFLGNEDNLADARRAYPDLKLFRLDASDLAAMHQLVTSQKTEVAFDLAVIPLPTSLSYPAWTIETNVGIATTLCELARWGNLQTLVHCSSSEAYGSATVVPMDESHPLLPSTPYAASKVSADHVVLSYILTFDIDAVVVRPFNNFGPRQNPGTYAGIIPIVISRVRKREPVTIHGDGEQTRDFIYAPHTADALVRIYDAPATRGKVINVATGHETSVNELVAMLLDVLGVPDHPVVHTPPRPGDVRRHCGDVRLFRELIGFEPPALSRTELAETIAWYLKSGTL